MKKQISNFIAAFALGLSACCLCSAAHAQSAGTEHSAAKAPAAKASASKTGHAAAKASKPAPAQQSQPSRPAPREDRMSCIYGIKSLEMRLIDQYPNLTQAFIDNYPRMASEAASACGSYVAYFITRTGKPVNMQNVRENVWDKLKLGDTVPDTLKSLETFRELMADGE